MRTRILGFCASGLISSLLPLRAADPIQTSWDSLCTMAGNRELTVSTTTANNPVKGRCVQATGDSLTLYTKHRFVTLARNDVLTLQVRRLAKRHPDGLPKALAYLLLADTGLLFSPAVAAGAVMFSGTLLYVSVDAVLSLVNDLRAKAGGPLAIQIL